MQFILFQLPRVRSNVNLDCTVKLDKLSNLTVKLGKTPADETRTTPRERELERKVEKLKKKIKVLRQERDALQECLRGVERHSRKSIKSVEVCKRSFNGKRTRDDDGDAGPSRQVKKSKTRARLEDPTEVNYLLNSTRPSGALRHYFDVKLLVESLLK